MNLKTIKDKIVSTCQEAHLYAKNNPEKAKNGAIAMGAGLLTGVVLVKKIPVLIGATVGALVLAATYTALDDKGHNVKVK